jgi:phage shock protein PspC (stress-responsive transcriptional regulator)
MNEVTQIHLGRQAFTIAADAHTALRAYLKAIEQAVGDKSVVEEVELRMAELLAEHGVSGEKVILPKDVEFLKAQLGDPKDFSDDEADDSDQSKESADKRLFRDQDNALIGGVAAGVANYFGIDALVVRLIFILLTFFGGGVGIVLYIVLWLILPPATTTSEKLQMRGLPVTLEALKDSVANADLAGKTKRASNSVAAVLDGLLRLAIKLIGVAFIVGGIAVLLAIVTVKTYMLAHNGQLFQENLFPVGVHEHILLYFGMFLSVIISIFLVLIGITTFRRKWPVAGWITAVLLGLFLVGTAATGALAADAVPHVQERYEALMHTTASKDIQPFRKVVSRGDIDLSYIASPDYAVNVHYADHPDLSKLKIYVANDTLYVDSTQLDSAKHCDMLCLFPRYNMTVQIYAPNVEDFNTPPHTDVFYPNVPAVPAQKT